MTSTSPQRNWYYERAEESEMALKDEPLLRSTCHHQNVRGRRRPKTNSFWRGRELRMGTSLPRTVPTSAPDPQRCKIAGRNTL
jgi:hypothetical protein